jgi:hypothetical protein
MGKTLAFLAVAVMASVGMVGIAAPASAHDHNCMSRTEYRKITKGMTKARVHRIVDTRGFFSDGHAGGYTRGYLRCSRVDGDATVYITYSAMRTPHRVAEKGPWPRYIRT